MPKVVQFPQHFVQKFHDGVVELKGRSLPILDVPVAHLAPIHGPLEALKRPCDALKRLVRALAHQPVTGLMLMPEVAAKVSPAVPPPVPVES